MDDRFREMEISRGARCVWQDECVLVSLPHGGEEQHWHDGGMTGRYPVKPYVPPPTWPSTNRSWWKRWVPLIRSQG